MGFPFSCPCLCWPSQRRHHQQQQEQQLIHSHSEPEADERTPLVSNPPPVTSAPSFPLIDTAQQQADEAAANKIISQTVRCLVDVYSHAPFSHLKLRGTATTSDLTTAEQRHTPDGSSSDWRAYDPPRAPPITSKASKYHLSTSSDYQSTPPHHGAQAAAQKRSFHSLKTIVNHQDVPSEPAGDECDTRLSASLIEQQTAPLLHRLSSSATLPESTQSSQPDRGHTRRNSFAPTSCSTQFDTIRTFQTARDHPNMASDDDDDDNNPQDLTLTNDFPVAHLDTARIINLPQLSSTPDFVTRLWDQPNPSASASHPPDTGSDQTSCQPEEPHHLTDDPKKLAEMISNGFRLSDTGPILVEL
ncbi:hypothetical protein VP01_3862g1 [Puccinia sorghi]|uniref:Uncharacterized protein n=1 Tax=Puccinia sorghi TaxID=27349 RepID=A0A0L6UTV3_9BASI|nr:hypothetical protein VP01_3862g1 [Puccinia sorghi]